MAGGMAKDYFSGSAFGHPNQEQQDLYLEWSDSFAADLKRNEEIAELRSLVTKLAEEVNRLERVISNMGPIIPIAQISQVSQIMELEGPMKMKIDEELDKLGLSIPNQSLVIDYLVRHLDMMDILATIARKVHQRFDASSQFSLEIVSDSDADEYMAVYVRQPAYDDSVMERIREIRSEYSPLLANKSGWFLLTTDYVSIGAC
jgi:hypothetical protein